MTNRCRATPNTYPDSPLDGESGEVFGFALHLFVTKIKASRAINLILVQFGIICIQKVGAIGIICTRQVGIIWRHMQQRVKEATKFNAYPDD